MSKVNASMTLLLMSISMTAYVILMASLLLEGDWVLVGCCLILSIPMAASWSMLRLRW